MDDRLKIESGIWYACTFFGDDMVVYDETLGGFSFSPILVMELKPLKTGQSKFVLRFFHANYPEGVNTKEYECLKLGHGRTFVLAQSDHGIAGRYLVIKKITPEWALLHWRESALPLSLRDQLGLSLSSAEKSTAQNQLRAWGVYPTFE